jgi:hypothetical protein
MSDVTVILGFGHSARIQLPLLGFCRQFVHPLPVCVTKVDLKKVPRCLGR